MNQTLPKILLIDDDEPLAALLVELFTLEQLTLHTAFTGDMGLSRVLNEHFDLVLLDVMLPNINGMDVLKRIRAAQNYTPIMMLTARGDETDKVLGLELGADDYLPKPYSDRELIARVKAILRRQQSWQLADNLVELYQVGKLTLKPSQQQAYYDEQMIDLTGAEYRILEILVKYKGNLVSKETLSAEALGKKLTIFDRNIDMHVSNLRKKLPDRVHNTQMLKSTEGLPLLEWIKTVRGHGYILMTHDKVQQ